MFKGGFNLGKFPSIRSSTEQLSHDSFNSGDRGENFLLRFEQLTNPLLSNFRHALHLFTGEGSALRRSLHFDKFAGAGHDKVHIDIGPAVFLVRQIQKNFAVDDAHTHSCNRIFDRIRSENSLRQPSSNSFPKRHVGARDRRRPRTAIGLDHVAIDPDRLFTEALQISNRPEAPTDEPLNLMGSPADLSTRCLAPNPHLRRARKHSILRRNPTLPAVAQKLRDSLFELRCTDDFGIPHFDQDRAVSRLQVAWRNRQWSQLPRFSTVRSHWSVRSSVYSFKLRFLSRNKRKGP